MTGSPSGSAPPSPHRTGSPTAPDIPRRPARPSGRTPIITGHLHRAGPRARHPKATGSPATQGPAGALRLVLVAGRAQQPDPHVGDLSGYDLAGQAQRGVLLVGGAVLGHPQFHVAALQ